MLYRILFWFVLITFSVSTFAYDAKSCEIKKEKLTEQMQYAKKYNNTYRINGLKRALDNLEKKCAKYSKQ